MNIVNHVTKECLVAIPDTSISGRRVARELTAIIDRREIIGRSPVMQARVAPVTCEKNSCEKAFRSALVTGLTDDSHFNQALPKTRPQLNLESARVPDWDPGLLETLVRVFTSCVLIKLSKRRN